MFCPERSSKASSSNNLPDVSSFPFFAPQQLLSEARGHPKNPMMNPMMKTNKMKETRPKMNFFCTDIPIKKRGGKPPVSATQLHVSYYGLFSFVWKFCLK